MTVEEYNQANIENLTGLWKVMGAEPLTSAGQPGIHACRTWPHRCWLDWGTGEAGGEALVKALPSFPETGVVPVWGEPVDQAAALEARLTENGYAERSSQTAMYLALEHCERGQLHAAGSREVREEADLAAWTEVCSASFGYAIDNAVVRRIAKDPGVQLLLLDSDNEPAATALLYWTGEVVGVHQVGVPPAFRGKGLARQIMHDALLRCLDSEAAIATLQASQAGRRLYDQLGFVEQFEIRNFRRETR